MTEGWIIVLAYFAGVFSPLVLELFLRHCLGVGFR